MENLNSAIRLNENKTKEQLIKELIDLQVKLASEQQRCRELSKENTRRKAGELQETQGKVSKAFLASPSFMFISELGTGIFTEVNDAYCALTGYMREEMIGHSSLELGIISDESRTEIIRRLQENGRVQNMESEIVSKTGEIKTCLFSAEAIRYSGRDCLICSGIDITERKRAEDALRMSEERFRLAAKAGKLGAYSRNLKTGENYWSPEFLAIFGIGPDDQLPLEDGIPAAVHPKDRPTVLREARARFDGAINPEFSCEHRIILPNGRIRWVMVRGITAFDDQGHPFLTHGFVMDITERKKREEEHRRTEERLRLAKEAADIGIHDYDVASGKIFWDDRVRKLWGVGPQTPITYDVFLSGLHPDDRQLVQQKVDQALNPDGDGEFYAEYRVRSLSDGIERWVAATGHVFFESERSVRLIGTVQNITQRKQAEAELIKSEERFRSVMENLSEGLMLFDEQGMIYQNPASLRIHGFKGPQEMRIDHKDFPTTWKGWDEAGRPLSFKEWPLFRVLRHESFQNQVLRAVETKTGKNFWASYNGFPILGADGKLTLGFITIRDITEAKLAEEALRKSERTQAAILEQIPDGIGVITQDGKFILSNSVFRNYVTSMIPSIDPEQRKRFQSQDAAGRPLPPDQWPGARALRGESVNPGIEFLYTDDHGSKVWILVSAVPFRSEGDEENIRAIAVIKDITKLKKTEQRLRELNETLEQQVAERTAVAEARAGQLQSLAVELIEAEERERRRFSELLHDDLQQDLASIRFQLQTALRSLSGPPPILTGLEKLLETTIVKSRRLSHEMSPAVLDHSGLVEALEWLVRKMDEQFGLQIRLKADATKNFENKTIKMFLFRAVQELLFNVFKHAGAKTVRVDLFEADGCIVTAVSDRGRGFDPEILHAASARAGLGLISLRERAAYLGGSMEIESAPGQGSRFTLTVPLTPAKGDESPCDEPTAEPGVFMPADHADSEIRENIRVLFADDHLVLRQGLISMIEDQPCIEVVGEAADGREALDLARQHRPDVIVMDVNMPEMDGVEATRRIKNELPDVRVIGLSMHQEGSIASIMREAGAEAFLTKTVSSSELLKAIYGTADHSVSKP